MIRSMRLARIALTIAALAGAGAATAADPGAFPWEARRGANVATAALTADDIAAFLGTVTAADAPIAVGDFRFANLLGDGKLQLIASVDYSGRRFFNTVLVVRRTAGGYAVQQLPALNAESLAHAVVDLDGDGKQELVLATALTPYLGAAYPQAKWEAIYAWSGRIYVERTAAYAGHYRASVLSPLRQRLINATVAGSKFPLAVAQIEHDKAVRMLPVADPDAGLATARALASDANPRLRILGAAVAADIGSPAAAAVLGTLATDADAKVASYAGIARERRRTDRCESVDISVQGTGASSAIDLASSDPIRVVIAPDSRRGAARAPVASVTFGESGNEQSAMGCAADGGSVVCEFAPGPSGLHRGDGVATLIAMRADGSCMKGQDAVEVVGD